MAQHDFIIDDDIGLPLREDLTAAVQALASLNSGPVAPLVVAGENDAYTKVMLHFDGPDGSTVITDTAVGGPTHTWTAVGNAAIDAAQSKFGGSSGYFDGTGDVVYSLDSPDFSIGTQDFTIDCWFNCTRPSGTHAMICAHEGGGILAFRLWRSTTNKFTANVFPGGADTQMSSITSFSDILNPGWHHIEMSREGATGLIRLFIDGVLEASLTGSTAAIPDPTGALCVGSENTVAANPWQGWIDEFRFTVGVVRHTAAFTPPDKAYRGRAPYAGMLWLDTTVAPNGQLRMRNQANTAWIGIAGFPTKATTVEAAAGIDDLKYVTPAGVTANDAVAPMGNRNRLVNPGMQISQQNGDTASGVNGHYMADQWQSIISAPGAVISAGRVSSVTPKGSEYRVRITVTTALASMAANDYFGIYQRIEGLRVSDFGWGAAGARQVILRFGFRGPAGTYSANIRNGAFNRSYGVAFVISAGQANTDTTQTIIIPGDVTGSWPNTTAASMEVWITLATGTGQAKAPNTWLATSAIAITGMSNNSLATVGNVFELFDVGLYLDADVTGIPPFWEIPIEADELAVCQRYFVVGVTTHFHDSVTSGNTYHSMAYLPVDMRVAPVFYLGANAGATSFPAAVGTITVNNVRTIYETRVANATTAGFFMSTLMFSARP